MSQGRSGERLRGRADQTAGKMLEGISGGPLEDWARLSVRKFLLP